MKKYFFYGLAFVLAIASSLMLNSCKKCPPCTPADCCIDFDNAPFVAGTNYASRGMHVVTACDFKVTTGELNSSGIAHFNSGTVEAAIPGFGSGNIFHTNNITLFFQNIGTPTTTVTIEYHHQQGAGGTENLSVNGQLYDGNLNAAPTSLGGVSVSVFSTIAVSGERGIVRLRGTIKDFSIGGKEFFIDDICRK